MDPSQGASPILMRRRATFTDVVVAGLEITNTVVTATKPITNYNKPWSAFDTRGYNSFLISGPSAAIAARSLGAGRRSPLYRPVAGTIILSPPPRFTAHPTQIIIGIFTRGIPDVSSSSLLHLYHHHLIGSLLLNIMRRAGPPSGSGQHQLPSLSEFDMMSNTYQAPVCYPQPTLRSCISSSIPVECSLVDSLPGFQSRKHRSPGNLHIRSIRGAHDTCRAHRAAES